MDLHQVFSLSGGLLALALFVPLAAATWKNHGAGQSFATWLLWAALDTILSLSIIMQQGNPFLPLGFALGNISMLVVLIIKKRFSWGRFETIILLGVLGCLAIWLFSGSKAATIATTLAICVAGVPGLVALWKDPQRGIGTVWAGQFVAAVLSFFGGTAMSVEERFAPAVFAAWSVAMWIAGWRRRNRGN